MNTPEILREVQFGKQPEDKSQAERLATEADTRLRELDMFNQWRALPQTQLVMTSIKKFIAENTLLIAMHTRFAPAVTDAFIRARLVEISVANQIIQQTFIDGTLTNEIKQEGN